MPTKRTRPCSQRRYGAKGLCCPDFTWQNPTRVGTVRSTKPAEPLGARASGVSARQRAALSCPIVASQSLHGDPLTSYGSALGVRARCQPLLLGCHAVFSIHYHTNHTGDLGANGTGISPSLAAGATDLYPRPKCHPAWVASPPGGSWAERLDDVGFCITDWHGNHVKRNRCRKRPPGLGTTTCCYYKLYCQVPLLAATT